MNKFYLFFLILVTLVYSCKKNQKDDQLSSITLNVSQQAQTVILSGQINNLSSDNVKQTGFLWSGKPDPIVGTAGVFVYMNASSTLQFDFNALSGFTKDSTYYVKAFYVDKSNSYHYSQQVSFKSNGTKQPKLTYLTKSYTWGDEVALKMDTLNMDNLNGINIIIDTNIIVHPTRISGSNIYFNIPNDVTKAYNSLSVSILGQGSNAISLWLSSPVITAGGDAILIVGNTLTINGQFFNPVLSKNIVTIGTGKLSIVSATASKLVVNCNNITMSQSGTLTVQTGTNLIGSTSNNYFIYKYLQPKKNFPGEARESSVAVVLNGAIYTGLGKSKATNQMLKDWWKYDPPTDTWTKVADCPQTAIDVNVFSINNKAYIGMGVFDNYPSNAFYSYDPVNNIWISIGSFPGTQTLLGAFFNSNQYGYIVGGQQSNSAGIIKVNNVWKFDPKNNSWKQLNSFPGTPREMATGFTLNNKGYVVGGDIQAPYSAITEAWSFDFATETWQQIASMPFVAGSNGVFAFGLNNKGYVGGGNNNDTDGISQLVYEYDPIANTWAVKEKILDPIVYGAAYTSIGNIGYVICGWSDTYPYSEGSQSFFQFTP
jgi:N-acetylneuraminic acid mutarotase